MCFLLNLPILATVEQTFALSSLCDVDVVIVDTIRSSTFYCHG